MDTPPSQEWKRTTDLNINLQQIIEQAALIPDSTPASEVDRFLLHIEIPMLPARKKDRKHH